MICREKQSAIEFNYGTEPGSTDNDEENETSEDDRSETFSNDDSIETVDPALVEKQNNYPRFNLLVKTSETDTDILGRIKKKQ